MTTFDLTSNLKKLVTEVYDNTDPEDLGISVKSMDWSDIGTEYVFNDDDFWNACVDVVIDEIEDPNGDGFDEMLDSSTNWYRLEEITGRSRREHPAFLRMQDYIISKLYTLYH